MKQGLTEIVCVLDKSGSMHSIINDAIGGFNSFLAEQKKVEGSANMTLALFNTNYNLVADNKNINEIEDLNGRTYMPGGGTALYDSIGRSILDVGQRLSQTDEAERPEKVIVAILTDGEENGSMEHNASDIKAMIEHQEEKYNWQFVFLAANQDAFDAGQTFGMKSHNSINFNATAKGAENAFDNIALYTTQIRQCANLTQDTMKSYTVVAESK